MIPVDGWLMRRVIVGQSLPPMQREILEKVRLKKKQGLTTGEVSKMLGIAQSTAVRFFDIGTLTGWRDSVTGRRMIDPQSVKAFVAFKRKRAVAIGKAVDAFARRRSKRQGLTTVEASRMLGISRHRVVTLFDQGTLTGYRHPVKRWVVIDRESVEALAKESGIELSE